MPFLVHEGVCSTEAGEGEVKCSASLASMSGLRLRTRLWPPETTSALKHFLVTLEREWIKTGNRLVEMSNQCCCPSLKPAVHPGWNISPSQTPRTDAFFGFWTLADIMFCGFDFPSAHRTSLSVFQLNVQIVNIAAVASFPSVCWRTTFTKVSHWWTSFFLKWLY